MSGLHVVVDDLAGSVTLAVHKNVGPYCLPVLNIVLDPDQVLDLATRLTRAAVPPPPVVTRPAQLDRVWVQKVQGTWRVGCPCCLEVLHPDCSDLATACDFARAHAVLVHAADETKAAS